jgi:hypothetical protein
MTIDQSEKSEYRRRESLRTETIETKWVGFVSACSTNSAVAVESGSANERFNAGRANQRTTVFRVSSAGKRCLRAKIS